MHSNGDHHDAGVVVSEGSGDRWSLVRRTGLGADVLAHSTAGAAGARRRCWQRAVVRLRDGDGTVCVRATADGHFRWIFTAPGNVVIESPPVYRDPETCRSAFADAQRAAGTALGTADRSPARIAAAADPRDTSDPWGPGVDAAV